jgi:Zn-dependent protease with chaperone function
MGATTRPGPVIAAVLLLAALVSPCLVETRDLFQSPAQNADTTNTGASAPSTTRAQPVTHYTLPPDRYEKARSLSRIRLWATLVSVFYGAAVLWFVLRWKISATCRTWAERASKNRFVQALIFAPTLIVAIDALSLPVPAFRNWVFLRYGLSVQGWGSWFWDQVKNEIVSVVIATIFVWVLYAVIRRSPRRWWLYFWMASLPIALAVFFLQPLVIDPLFFTFEPLASKEPGLTTSLEQMVQRAGEDIPRERMFWMNAGEKLTALNAYVTGFGASKRIVVWDTTIKKMTPDEIVFVAGHEMGHYVLGHIPKLIGLGAALLFALFYLGHRTIGYVLKRWGPSWGVRGLDDWASLPALLLLLSIFSFFVSPATGAVSRHYEAQADQYAHEVTRGLAADTAQSCAQAFQILGDVNLDDPEPNPVSVFLYYDHPPVRDRIEFCLTYDPWSKGQRGEFVP